MDPDSYLGAERFGSKLTHMGRDGASGEDLPLLGDQNCQCCFLSKARE